MRHNVRCWQFCVTLNIIILWVEQHEETDYFFNVPVGNRAGGNGAGSVGAADAVAERGASPTCSGYRASPACSECGT